MKEVKPAQNSRKMKEREFDLSKEKNLSNRVFSLGENREAHKMKEKAAKEKR